MLEEVAAEGACIAHLRHALHVFELMQGEPRTVSCPWRWAHSGNAHGGSQEHATSEKGADSMDGRSRAVGHTSKLGGVLAGEGELLVSDVDEEGIRGGIVVREAELSTGCARWYARWYGL